MAISSAAGWCWTIASLRPHRQCRALGPLPIPDGQGGTRPLLEIASLGILEEMLRAAGAPTALLWAGTEAWEIDSAVETRWVEAVAAGLAFASAAACSILDIEAVLIDGWLPARLRTRLVEETRKALGGFDLTGVEIPEIREGSIGADARSLGAASLPLSERYLVDLNAMLNAN